jgi:hypothetical protein
VPGPAGQTMPLASSCQTVAVTDDRSTDYRVSTANGGGDDRTWAGEIAIVPSAQVRIGAHCEQRIHEVLAADILAPRLGDPHPPDSAGLESARF